MGWIYKKYYLYKKCGTNLGQWPNKITNAHMQDLDTSDTTILCWHWQLLMTQEKFHSKFQVLQLCCKLRNLWKRINLFERKFWVHLWEIWVIFAKSTKNLANRQHTSNKKLVQRKILEAMNIGAHQSHINHVEIVYWEKSQGYIDDNFITLWSQPFKQFSIPLKETWTRRATKRMIWVG